VRSFASKSLVQTTGSFPALVCTNTAPGSQGCLFRIYAANLLGFGAPSKPVALWAVPSAPRALDVLADPDFTTAALMWKPPAADGGLRVTGYDVLGSMDGAPPHVLTTVATLNASVACTAARTCAYSVRAINAHGKGPASAPATVTPAPGQPQGVTLENTGSDPATGRTVLKIAWLPPVSGLPPEHFDAEVCGLRVDVPGSCDPASSGWAGRIQMYPVTGAPFALTANCQSGVLTCLMRVRGVNDRGGEGAWRAVDLRPWAPFSLTVAPGPTRGSVTVHFLGPRESGRSGTETKHYRVIVCDTVCNVASNWRIASDAVPYPPTPPAPFLAGSFLCRAAPVTGPPQPRQCRVRMQFFDGTGAAGILSAAASGSERP
jgi:hypothetical protein